MKCNPNLRRWADGRRWVDHRRESGVVPSSQTQGPAPKCWPGLQLAAIRPMAMFRRRMLPCAGRFAQTGHRWCPPHSIWTKPDGSDRWSLWWWQQWGRLHVAVNDILAHSPCPALQSARFAIQRHLHPWRLNNWTLTEIIKLICHKLRIQWEYTNRNDPIRWQISTSIKVILEHFCASSYHLWDINIWDFSLWKFRSRSQFTK